METGRGGWVFNEDRESIRSKTKGNAILVRRLVAKRGVSCVEIAAKYSVGVFREEGVEMGLGIGDTVGGINGRKTLPGVA